MKYFFETILLFFVLYLNMTYACEIELCQRFLILDSANPKSHNMSDGLIKSSSCSEEERGKVLQFLAQTHGTFNTSLLQKYFNNITFWPKQIEIKKLTQDLGIDYSKHHLVTSIEKIHFQKGSLCVGNSDIVTTCDSCNSAGKKNLTLTIRGDVVNYTIPIDAVLKAKVRAYMIDRPISPGERLEATSLREIDLQTETPAQTQINIDKINFYSSTRTLHKGDILKTTDIIPATIVKPGKTCRVILRTANLNLQTEGRALQGATLGQSVQVQLKHKTVSAAATNFDEVTVEL